MSFRLREPARPRRRREPVDEAVPVNGVRSYFALVALLGLLGLRIFEACGSNIADLGEEHRPGVTTPQPRA